MVKAVPLNSDSALLATRVENKGESATTTIPQKMRNPTKIEFDSIENNHGDRRQQIQENNKAINAVFFVPTFAAIVAPITQDNPPLPIMTNDQNGTLRLASK